MQQFLTGRNMVTIIFSQQSTFFWVFLKVDALFRIGSSDQKPPQGAEKWRSEVMDQLSQREHELDKSLLVGLVGMAGFVVGSWKLWAKMGKGKGRKWFGEEVGCFFWNGWDEDDERFGLEMGSSRKEKISCQRRVSIEVFLSLWSSLLWQFMLWEEIKLWIWIERWRIGDSWKFGEDPWSMVQIEVPYRKYPHWGRHYLFAEPPRNSVLFLESLMFSS